MYGHPKVEDRHLSWSLLKVLSQKCSLPWLVGGDFNEILASGEKEGGLPRCVRQMQGFREAVDFCSLCNLHSAGPSFTWRGNRGGEDVCVRLDRFLATSSWSDLFPVSRAVNLKPSRSDRLPILIEVREFTPKKKKKKQRRFHFEESWLRDDVCRRIVELGWESTTNPDPFTRICYKISSTRRELMEWSNSCFGKLREEIERIRTQLSTFLDSSFSAPTSESRMTLESKLNELLQQEHPFWKQRAKVFWLMDGDLNTKFFHRSASNRRRKNMIKGLFNKDGVWCTTDEDMESTILHHFGELFTSSDPTNITELVNHLPSIVTDEMNNTLTKEFSAVEIHSALKQMHPSKAPGPDGFSPCFYQHFWPLVGNDMVEAICTFMESDAKIKILNCTHVTLIPKVKSPLNLSQMRPISLCNVLYKIGSEVLANRLKPLLQQFISPFQSVFVPGRLISDNSLIAFEIAHFMKRKRDSKVGYGDLKLDMSKAYD